LGTIPPNFILILWLVDKPDSLLKDCLKELTYASFKFGEPPTFKEEGPDKKPPIWKEEAEKKTPIWKEADEKKPGIIQRRREK